MLDRHPCRRWAVCLVGRLGPACSLTALPVNLRPCCMGAAWGGYNSRFGALRLSSRLLRLGRREKKSVPLCTVRFGDMYIVQKAKQSRPVFIRFFLVLREVSCVVYFRICRVTSRRVGDCWRYAGCDQLRRSRYVECPMPETEMGVWRPCRGDWQPDLSVVILLEGGTVGSRHDVTSWPVVTCCMGQTSRRCLPARRHGPGGWGLRTIHVVWCRKRGWVVNGMEGKQDRSQTMAPWIKYSEMKTGGLTPCGIRNGFAMISQDWDGNVN